jgi:hypothetical protein
MAPAAARYVLRLSASGLEVARPPRQRRGLMVKRWLARWRARTAHRKRRAISDPL